MLQEEKLKWLNDIGIALSSEPNTKILLQKILLYAKKLTGADGGTLYTVTPNNMLHFEIVSTDSLNYFVVSGEEEHTLPFLDIPLMMAGERRVNARHIVANAVLSKKSINIEDAYEHKGFDFSGTKQFDQKTGYRTKSVLTIPLINHEGNVIAALQLINAKDPHTAKIVTFSEKDQRLAESLASQAGIAYTNQSLLLQLRSLFNTFIRIISDAIDEKSPSTGNHGKRVPVLAVMLAEAVNDTHSGPLKNVKFSKDEIYEIEVAALLHDCGKIVTPTHIVEKHHKLETIVDRITFIEQRLENAKKQHRIDMLEKKLKWLEELSSVSKEIKDKYFTDIDNELLKEESIIDADLKFLQRCNEAKEMIDDKALKRLQEFVLKGILTQDEYTNLAIAQGNLTWEERKIMEHHVEVTYDMLKKLPFPKELAKVPEIAAAHHERVDGKGYPHGLKKDEMLIQARLLAIVDVFEALSAPDRPYKLPLSLSKIYEIMEKKVEEGHLDRDLFDVFMKKGVGFKYAKKYLAPEQLDITNHYSVLN